jgi:8-oxo-dGTP diphosphatase
MVPNESNGPRHTARGIVLRDGQLLLMERWRPGRHYFSIPGGGIEAGEIAGQAVVREILEETTIIATVGRKVLELHVGDVRHEIFICQYVSGEPRLTPDAPEALHMTDDNRFRPLWMPVADLTELSFGFLEALRQPVINGLRDGFDEGVMIVNGQPSG